MCLQTWDPDVLPPGEGTTLMADNERQHQRGQNDILSDLEQLSQQPGFIYSFSLMVARCLWMSIDELAEVDWHDRPNQAELSLLFGLMAKTPIRLDQLPTEELILKQVEQATEILGELHRFLSMPMSTIDIIDADMEDSFAGVLQRYENWMDSGAGMVEPIFY